MTDYNDGEWHDWFGGEKPLPPYKYVEFITRNRESHLVQCKYLDWQHLPENHEDHESDIIMFRVVENTTYKV